jgi:M6 family metalloprotease-like protein
MAFYLEKMVKHKGLLLAFALTITSVSCGSSFAIVELPKVDYVEGDFFTLNGLKVSGIGDKSADDCSIYLDGDSFADGRVLKDIGEHKVYLDYGDYGELSYDIEVKAEGKSDRTIEGFTYYDLAKNANMNALPSSGDIDLLVIPVTIKGYEKNATSKNKERIEEAFSGDFKNYYSVQDFYEKSSYGEVSMDVTVSDRFDLGLSPDEIYLQRTRYGDDGTYYVLDEALKWYQESTGDDLTKFDSDKDGLVDAVWLVYSAPNYTNASYDSRYSSAYRAFTYRDYVNIDEANILEPLGGAYARASFDFLNYGYGDSGVDSHTFIHETGHLFGLLDYYNTDGYYNEISGKIDTMDIGIGDHNAMSKYSLGWVEPTVVKESGKYTLKPFEEDGDFILIGGDNFKNTAFDEYFTIEYITPTGLNEPDYTTEYKGVNIAKGYSKAGIRISHADNRGASYESNKTIVSYDPDDIVVNYASNSMSDSHYYGSNYMYQYSIMNANYPAQSPLSPSYKALDEALYMEGDSFDFKEDSKYFDLMPSHSNALNKYLVSDDDGGDGGDETKVSGLYETLEKLQSGETFAIDALSTIPTSSFKEGYTASEVYSGYALEYSFKDLSNDEVTISGYANHSQGVMLYSVVDGYVVPGKLVDGGKTIATSSRVSLPFFTDLVLFDELEATDSYNFNLDLKKDTDLIDNFIYLLGYEIGDIESAVVDQGATISYDEDTETISILVDCGEQNGVLSVDISNIGGSDDLNEIKTFLDEGLKPEPFDSDLLKMAELKDENAVFYFSSSSDEGEDIAYFNGDYFAIDFYDNNATYTYTDTNGDTITQKYTDYAAIPLIGVEGVADGLYECAVVDDKISLPLDDASALAEYNIANDVVNLENKDLWLESAAISYLGLPYLKAYSFWDSLYIFSDKMTIFEGFPDGFYSFDVTFVSELTYVFQSSMYLGVVILDQGEDDAESTVYIFGVDSDLKGHPLGYTGFGGDVANFAPAENFLSSLS